MTADTIRLIHTRTYLRRCPDHNRNHVHTLTWDIRKSLSTETHHQAETYTEEIGAFLENPQDKPLYLKAEHAILKRWYCHASERQHKPSRADLEKLSGYYAVIYQREGSSSPGRPIPIHVDPFQIEGGVFSEVKEEVAVIRLKRNNS